MKPSPPTDTRPTEPYDPTKPGTWYFIIIDKKHDENPPRFEGSEIRLKSPNTNYWSHQTTL